jgi:L-aminopeptidase/D-esterase-like protein
VKTKKPHRFFFHLNKPRTREAGLPVWSFHYEGTCYIANKIVCDVPLETKSNKRQPYAVVQGMARTVRMHAQSDGTVEIHASL